MAEEPQVREAGRGVRFYLVGFFLLLKLMLLLVLLWVQGWFIWYLWHHRPQY
jgi:hypothetical protein